MNFLNSFFSGAQNALFNLQQRSNPHSSAFLMHNHSNDSHVNINGNCGGISLPTSEFALKQELAQQQQQQQQHQLHLAGHYQYQPSKHFKEEVITGERIVLQAAASSAAASAGAHVSQHQFGQPLPQQINSQRMRKDLSNNLPQDLLNDPATAALLWNNQMGTPQYQQQQQQQMQGDAQDKQLQLTKMNLINQLLLNGPQASSNSTAPAPLMSNQSHLLQAQLQRKMQASQEQLQQQYQLNTPQQFTHSLQGMSAFKTPSLPSNLTNQRMMEYQTTSQQIKQEQNLPQQLTTTEAEESDDDCSQQHGKGPHKKSIRKRTKKMNGCGHPDREHYAKGLCSNCYHKYGRTKKPWLCEHDKLYACGLCQNCYINKYNQVITIKYNHISNFIVDPFSVSELKMMYTGSRQTVMTK